MIAWLVQSQAEIPAPPTDWLSSAEQAEYVALRVAKRRQDWLAGRWTAKRLIQATQGQAGPRALDAIQISPAQGRAPQACWPGCSRPWPLSISHCDGWAAAALADNPNAPLGIDLEHIQTRATAFACDYFTPAELASLSQNLAGEAEQVTAIWCAKEAALKALGVGLTVDTRAVNVWLDRSQATWQGWRRLEVDVVGTRLPEGLAGVAEYLHGWWRQRGPYLLAIVTSTPNIRAAGWPVEILQVASQETVA